jgi:hypothetical protein
MTLFHPLARRLEQLVYEGVCAIAQLSPVDGSDGARTDPLASPLVDPTEASTPLR